MLGAIKAASDGMGINRAAREFSIALNWGEFLICQVMRSKSLCDYLITCSERITQETSCFRKTLENKNGGPT